VYGVAGRRLFAAPMGSPVFVDTAAAAAGEGSSPGVMREVVEGVVVVRRSLRRVRYHACSRQDLVAARKRERTVRKKSPTQAPNVEPT
jgi:hypothetical protein